MRFSLPNLKNLWEKHRFFLFLLALVVFLRLPSLFEPYSYGDEGIYLTLGEAARRGLVLYREIHDNKPPLLYLLAALAGSLFWFRFLLLIWNLATIYIFYHLAKTLFPQVKNLNRTATVIFAIFSSIPLLEGNIANAEIFMILPIIGGVLLVLRGLDLHRFWLFFSAGILFSLATLFKVPAAFDFLAILIFLIFFYLGNLRKNISHITYHISLLLGFSLPIFITIVYFWSQGALNQYLTAAFFQNIPYLSSWGEETKVSFANLGLIIRAGLLGLFFVFLWLKQKEFNHSLVFVSLWFVFSLFAALLSERPYPHYLIQVLPSFSLLIGALFVKFKAQEKIFCSFLLGSLVFSFFYFRFWAYPVFSYYQNFLAFALGQQTQQEYFQNFGGKVNQTYQLAEFLVNHTYPDERVFAWGEAAPLYALSRRLPPVRYTVSYHTIDFNGYQETIKALEKERPRFIIDLNDESRPFPQLKSFLAQNYFFFQKLGNAQIFRLAP